MAAVIVKGEHVGEDRVWQIHVPSGFQEPPTTVLGALQRAKRVLSDEHSWVQGQWFNNSDPDLDPENAYCNSWQVCAAGAIGIVTIGNVKGWVIKENGDRKLSWMFDEDIFHDEAAYKLYTEACEAVRNAAPPEYEYEPDEGEDDPEPSYCDLYGSVPDFNDSEKIGYTDVIAAFDKAIATEEARQLTSTLT
jgi:hypothetical protein